MEKEYKENLDLEYYNLFSITNLFDDPIEYLEEKIYENIKMFEKEKFEYLLDKDNPKYDNNNDNNNIRQNKYFNKKFISYIYETLSSYIDDVLENILAKDLQYYIDNLLINNNIYNEIEQIYNIIKENENIETYLSTEKYVSEIYEY